MSCKEGNSAHNYKLITLPYLTKSASYNGFGISYR